MASCGWAHLSRCRDRSAVDYNNAIRDFGLGRNSSTICGCRCPKHLRWSQDRKQHRASAHTRSWAEAEKKKREIEDQLSGRTPEVKPEQEERRDTQACIDIFLQDKKVQGVTASVLGKYTRELARLREYCENSRVYTVQGITRELLTGFCATWSDLFRVRPERHYCGGL